MTALLRKEQRVNHKRVQRIMQCEGLQCRVRMENDRSRETHTTGRKFAGAPISR
ncbi:IS3 family transposase [Paenibacillus polymyxa]|uniref:IS3 family transposase n=1 Tax=Paenibacillus polymyxa TaxID=1406 RepID=UPI0009B5E81D